MRKFLLLEPSALKPTRPDFEVIGVFNPAITKFNDQYIMIARVAERAIQSDPDNYLLPHYEHNKGICLRKVPIGAKDFDYSDCRIVKNHEATYLTSISHLRILRSDNGIDFDPDSASDLPDNIYEEYGIEDPRSPNRRYLLSDFHRCQFEWHQCPLDEHQGFFEVQKTRKHLSFR